MKIVFIDSAWHICQIAYYMLKLIQDEREPVQCKFQDITIMMIPDKQDDTFLRPEWEERLIPSNRVINQ